jgi:hypothetical protein
MGIFKRADSPYWYLFLELTKQKEKTQILIGTTVAERKESKRLAHQVYVARMHQLGSRHHRLPEPRATTPTFTNFARWYDANVIVHHRGASREREILRRLDGDFGHLALDAITQAHVIAWRTERRATPTVIEHFGGPKGPRRVFPPPSARTVNREVDLLQQILKAAVPRLLDHSPLDGLRDLPVVPPVRRTLSLEEEDRLLAVLRVDDRAIFLCALDGLARLTDVLDLTRADDLGHELLIRHPKNGHAHTVPISSRLRAALDAVPPDPFHPEWYFARRRGAATERDRRNGYLAAFKRACQQAHVPYGRASRGLTFHWATRRTGATRMIRAGGDGAIATTQRIGNWKDAHVLIEIYQETLTADMQAAVEAVGGGRPLPRMAPVARQKPAYTRGSIPESFPVRPKLVKK